MADDTDRLFNRLFAQRTIAPVFLTSLSNDKSKKNIAPKFICTRDFDEVHDFRTRWDQPDRALYFCVSTIKEGKSRSKDNVSELTCLFCDIDLRDIQESREEVLEILKQQPYPPHLIVWSGHGFHCYWVLTETCLASTDTIARFERDLQLIASKFSGDTKVCQVAALLRVPGSHNTKYGEWIEVRIECEAAGVYDLEALEAWLADGEIVLHGIDKPKHTVAGSAPHSVYGKFAQRRFKPPLDWETEFAAMSYHARDETSIHWTQLRVMASMLSCGLDIEEATDIIFAATERAAGSEWSSWDLAEEYHTIQAMGAAWFTKHPEYSPEGREAREQKADADEEEVTKIRLLQSSAEFVANFSPPDYLIDGLLQRRYVYSLTAPTGSGKTAVAMRLGCHVALGLPMAGRDVEKGRVLVFAGENPDDVRSRWIKQCEELGQDPKKMDVVFMPFTPELSKDKIREQIYAEAREHGLFSLLIVDTSAAYYSGNDENDNVQLGNHARLLRSFVDLPGGPAVLVTCHPTKNPNQENLLPRGGGAFLAEVDGNLVCLKETGSMVVEVTTHGKFRGPDFKPFAFKLVPGQSDKLVDTKGRRIWTITAQPISDAEQEEMVQAGNRNENELLRAMLDFPDMSLMDLAMKLNWTTVHGQPNKRRIQYMMDSLKKYKLVEKRRDGSHYVLTDKGVEEAGNLPPNHYIVVTPIVETAQKSDG